MNKTALIFAAATVLSIGVAISATPAHSPRIHSPRIHSLRSKPNPSGKIAPWEAMKIAEKKVGGRALTANFEFDDGHWIYGVMVVQKGRLKEVEINPNTGAIYEVEDSNPASEAKELEQDLKQALKG